MKELLRTNNPVTLSFVEALLRDAGINVMVVDQHMSILEGSIGVLPRRLLVDNDDHNQAVRVLNEAGLSDELC